MDDEKFDALCSHLNRKVGFGRSEDLLPPKRQYRGPLYKLKRLPGALSGYLKCFRLLPTYSYVPGPTNFLNECLQQCVLLARHELTIQTGIKMWLCLVIEFEKTVDPNTTILVYFGSCQIIILQDQIEIASCFPAMLKSIETFEQNGSGWTLKHVNHLDIHIAHYSPLRAGCVIILPSSLKKKQAIVNIENNDNKCFLWCILAALHPRLAHAERVQHYTRYEHELNLEGIEFPVALSQIFKFEKLNSISINVYGFERFIFPLRISQLKNYRHVDLLLVDHHYCLVRNLNRLLGDQNRYRGRKFFCHRCLIPCYCPDKLKDHLSTCMNNPPTRTMMPKQSKLQFQNYTKMLRRPLVVYADFECLTEKIEQCEPTDSGSYTSAYQLHTPCGVGYVQKFECCEGAARLSAPVIYRGQDCVEQFLRALISVANDFSIQVRNPKPLRLSITEENNFRQVSNCHICRKEVGTDRVRDHCHLCGKFRGASHSVCNQQYKLSTDVVVIFHNLRRYDGHLIMQELGQICKKYNLTIECIAKGVEDYVTFSIKKGREWRLRFIDSCQFLLCSLEKLVEGLPADKFYITRQYMSQFPLDLVLRKNVYPYDYMDSWKRFEEQNLPAPSDFFSQLNNEHISNGDYAHAQRVWELLTPKNLGQYHDFYLTVDVLLLTDVFENFRSVCMTNYGLDPCHYCTLPSYAWDACLKMTDVQLDLATEPDMYTFIENGIRGGISVITHRFARANNPYIANHDPSIPNSYIMYLDANNLYGWAMVQPLPVSNFCWLTRQEIEAINWENLQITTNGYILEVDLEYPASLHEMHNDYPVAPESLHITDPMLSSYCIQTKPTGAKETTKLVPNLMDKTKYTVHYKNLQLYLSLGMRLKKIHRVLRFEESAWMKPYIVFNTEQRKLATYSFVKDLLKPMNNAVFGKTMENVRRYLNVELVTKKERYKKLVSNPRYQRSSRFAEDLVAVCMNQKSVSLCKPIYVGFCVLELSKLLMYKFHYHHMMSMYGKRLKLLFTDTDSLCYHVETQDVYDDMYKDLDEFDTSDYSPEHRLHSQSNKKVLGKFKDEMAGDRIEEFVGLRAKMYSFTCRGKETKRAKGIKKNVVRQKITHQDYVDTLFNGTLRRDTMQAIRSMSHKLYSIKQHKISLSVYDDKRYIRGDGVSSYAYGHFLINNSS